MEAPGLLLEHKKWQQVDWNIKVIFFLQMQVNSVCLEPIPKTLSLIKSYMVFVVPVSYTHLKKQIIRNIKRSHFFKSESQDSSFPEKYTYKMS